MTRRNSIDGFPPEVRRMIQRRLYQRGFQDYAGLVKELVSEGHAVSKSALHRFGCKFEARVKQAELEKLMGPEVPAAGNASGGEQLDFLDVLEGETA